MIIKRHYYNHIVVALLLSVPLAPYLVTSLDKFNRPITGGDIMLAAPAVIEFIAFNMVYIFANNWRGKFTDKERRALLTLGIGMFAIMSVPFLITELIGNGAAEQRLVALLLLVYAGINLFHNVKRLSESSDKITKYLLQNYIYPIVIAQVLFWPLILGFGVVLNLVAVYYVVKNFTLTN